MRITFTQKELKTNRLDISYIEQCYLIAIHDQNPAMWAELMAMLKAVEKWCYRETTKGATR